MRNLSWTWFQRFSHLLACKGSVELRTRDLNTHAVISTFAPRPDKGATPSRLDPAYHLRRPDSIRPTHFGGGIRALIRIHSSSVEFEGYASRHRFNGFVMHNRLPWKCENAELDAVDPSCQARARMLFEDPS